MTSRLIRSSIGKAAFFWTVLTACSRPEHAPVPGPVKSLRDAGPSPGEPGLPPVAGEQDVREIVASLQRLARVEETAPFLPFVTPRARSWLMDQKMAGVRALLGGELRDARCEEGRCLAWLRESVGGDRVLVFFERASGLLWDPIASLEWAAPDPGADDPANRDLSPEEVRAMFPGEGPLVAVLETNGGTLRCILEETLNPEAVALFVGLATGRRAHREPTSGTWVQTPCFDGQALRLDRESRGLQFFCPAGIEDIGPGFFRSDALRRGLSMDRPGRLAFDPRGPNRVGGILVLSLAPDPERDGRVSVVGQCGPEELLQAMAEKISRKREVGSSRPPYLKQVSIGRQGRAAP